MAGTGPDGAWTEAVRLATIPREQKKKDKKTKRKEKNKNKTKDEEGEMDGVSRVTRQCAVEELWVWGRGGFREEG